MDYDFAILDFFDESDEATALRRGWIGGVLRGFRDDRPEDELITRWVNHYRTDRVTVQIPASGRARNPKLRPWVSCSQRS